MKEKEAVARQRKKEREEERMAADPEYAAMMAERKAEYTRTRTAKRQAEREALVELAKTDEEAAKKKNPNIRLGKWGRMRKEYLRLANPVLFSDMVLNETLYEHCAEIEETAKKRMEIIVPQLAKAYGVTEQLKAENQIEWVRQMNACVAQAEEAIKGELIYC